MPPILTGGGRMPVFRQRQTVLLSTSKIRATRPGR
jgi:hypothetical protein